MKTKIDKKKFDEIRYFNKLNSISNNHNKYKNFNISKDDCNKSGIYKIQLNNEIYIGQTKNFYKRYTEHKRKLKNKTLYYDTSELLLNNGTFEILELENNKKKRNILETKWIKRYRGK